MSGLLDWSNLLFRVIHIVAGIGWIGSSFYFIWLDRHLTPSPARDPRVEGELWMVHSGGFYRVEKRKVGPGELPASLHWVKWEATLTLATGLILLAVVYYLTGGVYLLDPAVSSLQMGAAVVLSLGVMVGGWLAYEAVWRSPLKRAGWPAAAVSLALLGLITYGLTHALSGRAAFIHVGALLGTIMVANVWVVILPSQRRMVAATNRGLEPDHTLGAAAKVRSVHNSYLTFPVIFTMVSSHFPQTYANGNGWLILMLLTVAGACARHAMIGRLARGPRKEWALVPMVGFASAAIVLATPRTGVRSDVAMTAGAVSGATFAEARVVIATRCVSCHSAAPTDGVFTAAPTGVAFDTPEQMVRMASRIRERAVIQRTMPFANRTGITDGEREILRRWIESGALLR